MLIFLILINGLFIAAWAWFTLESFKEHEPRAPKIGLLLTGIGLALLLLILFVPWIRPLLTAFYGLLLLCGFLLLIPARFDPRTRAGAAGWIQGDPERFDERDTVFARNRSLPPDSRSYREYYQRHPELEAADAERRNLGGPLGRLGRIDGGHRPTAAQTRAAIFFPSALGREAALDPEPECTPAEVYPDEAALRIKGLARHLGADLVGITRVNPLWIYSHRGEIHYDNWSDWGRPLSAELPYAVVIATEMDRDLVAAAPHTPTVVESAVNYAQGAYISTILARWLSFMGYRGEAQHNRHYTTLLVPLAVDAGLGETGRQGYCIAPRFGCRVRLFAVLTDMPLAVDQPRDLGIEAFCRRCKKCAWSCPSKSIPLAEKSEVKGSLRWKLNAQSCFDYWAKVGTDCSLCMAVCPFSRPDTPLHRITRWFIARSALARIVFPVLDTWLYGRKWKSRPAPDWAVVDSRG